MIGKTRFAASLITAVILPFNIIIAGDSTFPPEVNEILEKAGTNRVELEKTLNHYKSDPDTLKYQAACYLIGNMEGHSCVTYALKDTLGSEIEFNVLDYPDFDALLAAFDTLESRYGPLDFDKQETVDDWDAITSGFLIDQIDNAFKAWRGKPWAKRFSFQTFCEYILPYRGSNEPLEEWRSMFLTKYAGFDSRMTDPADPIEATKLINNDVMTWFTFNPRFYYHPTDQGLSEMLNNGLGRCEDMTNVTIYALRANGLPVTSDYTPYWANSGNNHAWNAIVTPDGKVVPFMGAEANPGEYRLANKLAKVYRKTFGKQKENLIFQKRKQEKVPRWLAGRSYADVTADYVDACDVTIGFEQEIPDSVDIAYLCVFNSGEWQPIHWGRIEAGKAVFTDMGRDIAYLPALYLDEKIVPWGRPFILDPDGHERELRPEDNLPTTLTLTSTTKRKQEISTDGVARAYFNSGKEYELFYFDDGWQSSGKSTAEDKPLNFENVPTGSLYWLVEIDSDKEERIFTIEDGLQVWW